MKTTFPQDYQRVWEELFSSRDWGKYPPEDLIRFMARNFKSAEKRIQSTILEVGCGTGANVWFLCKEGFNVFGIDSSETGIKLAKDKVSQMGLARDDTVLDLRVGNFVKLPWEDGSVDAVIDIFAIYANPPSVIQQVIKEIYRVLRPGGLFYSKLWGTETTGYGSGARLDRNTFDEIQIGPCAGMGVSCFFDIEEITETFDLFVFDNIQRVTKTTVGGDVTIEEFHCQFSKSPIE